MMEREGERNAEKNWKWVINVAARCKVVKNIPARQGIKRIVLKGKKSKTANPKD